MIIHLILEGKLEVGEFGWSKPTPEDRKQELHGLNAFVHSSTRGKKCFVGHMSLVVGVRLKDGSFVPPGTVVNTQEKADIQGPIPESLKGFNDEVVKVNTEFAKVYLLMGKS